VSYVDSDNDEITVSSDEELQDFYSMSHKEGQVIKFAVVDLHTSQNNAGKPLEFPSLNRNPFDGDTFEFVGEWERFPTGFVAEEDSPKSGPHAFVEVLSSSNSVANDLTHQMDAGADTDDGHSTVQPPSLNKGKGRSLSFGAASITSVLGEETSHKHPIHVFDHNSRKDGKGNNFDNSSAYIHAAAQSTPKVQAKDIDDNRDTQETPKPSQIVEVDDPPLPSLDESPPSATSPSLVQDLASLVCDAAQAVSSHPELSEGLRNIGRNISSGTYWTTYREALSNTVNGTSNPSATEERRQVKEEAAIRRLTDIVDNFFRTLSEVPAGTEEGAPNIDENQSRDESFPHVSPPWYRPRGPLGRMSGRRSHHHGHFPPFGPFPHDPYAPGSDNRHGMPHHGLPGFSRPRSFPSHPVPPPPPPPHAPAGPPASYRASSSKDDHGSLAPPPPEKIGPSFSAPVNPPPNIPPPSGSPTAISAPSINNRRQSYQGYVASLPISDEQPHSQPHMSAQELRAQVEAAKRVYRAEKDRYRQERDRRRRDKLACKPTVRSSVTAGITPVPEAEVPREPETSSIQFQGMYPELERVGVPRRSHTHLGHGPFRHLDRTEDLTARAIARITKKLADMGFSQNAYPALPEKIKAQMPLGGATISKEMEDDVVTTLLEELLATSRPNLASGSGQKDVDMAEAWH
jgi:Wiskott-Aldrich syndrome protein